MREEPGLTAVAEAIDRNDASKLRLVVAVIGVTGLATFVWFYNRTLEDAFITFRYARNMAGGLGFGVWNASEQPVEGFSSPLWMLVTYLGMLLHLSPFRFAKLVGWLSYLTASLACCFAYYRAARRKSVSAADRLFLLYAALLFAGYLPFCWYALTGMETTFFYAQATLLVLLPRLCRGRKRVVFSMVLSCTLVLSRPEGPLLAVIGNLFALFDRERDEERRYRDVMPGLTAAFCSWAAITAFRFFYFRSLVPNTYFAKGSGGILHLIHGTLYFGSWLKSVASLLSLVVLAFLLGKRGRAPVFTLLLACTALYCAYIVKVGGDPPLAFPMWRHMVHMAPIWVLLVAISVAAIAPRFRIGVCILGVALVVSDASIAYHNASVVVQEPFASIRRVGLLHDEPPFAMLPWIGRFTDENTVSAIALAGQWPYYSRGRFIDMLGLTDEHIAHHGTFSEYGPVDSKSDMPYVIRQAPDVIDGYMNAEFLRHGSCPPELSGFRSEMLGQMLNSNIFKTRYYFVTNAPYDSLPRAIFVRDEFYRRSEPKGMQAVRVASTVLYDPGCVAQHGDSPAKRILDRLRGKDG